MVPPEFSNYDLTHFLVGLPPWGGAMVMIANAVAAVCGLGVAIVNAFTSRSNSRKLNENTATTNVVASNVNGYLAKLREEMREKDVIIAALRHERNNAAQIAIAAAVAKAKKDDPPPEEPKSS